MQNFDPSQDITSVEIDGQPVHIEAETVPRFRGDDPALIEYFYQYGYVVIEKVLDEQEIAASEDNLWEYLDSNAGMKRNDPATWTVDNLKKIGMPENGILRHTIGNTKPCSIHSYDPCDL
jgi:hypothetical protein